jgi:predicted ArsR family transcriptional regulator
LDSRDIEILGLMVDDTRRRLYRFTQSHAQPITREQAAEAVGVSRELAAFHLDKLLNAGLLEAHYERPSGRAGPGAGRTSKLYRPTSTTVEVSIPARRYDVLGGILVQAIDGSSSGESTKQVAGRVARQLGLGIGRAAGGENRRRSGSTLELAEEVLSQYGFEPQRDGRGGLTLRNCPYQALARQSPELVCGINQAFLGGVLEGIANGRGDLLATLEPMPGQCCVHLHSSQVKPAGGYEKPPEQGPRHPSH